MKGLENKDKIDIILPASGCSKEEYEAAIKFVESFGLVPRCRAYEEVIKPGLCSNSVEYRFEHLIEALTNDESNAVWCLKGGYGSQQLLEKLDEVVNPSVQKTFIGFSDITILLNYFADKWGWNCLHGPMPGQAGQLDKESWDRLSEILFADKREIRFVATPLNQPAHVLSSVRGRFLGGCLSLMQALIGTSHMPELSGAVLLLEDDRFETPRRMDRIFDHMLRAGVFYDVEAVILGNFLEEEKNYTAQNLELQEVLGNFANALEELGVPLLQNKGIGHCKNMITVPIGVEASVNLGDSPEVMLNL